MINTKEVDYNLNREPKTNDRALTRVINEVGKIINQQSLSSFEVPLLTASPQELETIYSLLDIKMTKDPASNIDKYISQTNIFRLTVCEIKAKNGENKIVSFFYSPSTTKDNEIRQNQISGFCIKV